MGGDKFRIGWFLPFKVHTLRDMNIEKELDIDYLNEINLINISRSTSQTVRDTISEDRSDSNADLKRSTSTNGINTDGNDEE